MFAQTVMVLGAALHLLVFAWGELMPWPLPKVLAGVLKERTADFVRSEFKDLTVTIVHNAGIYNVIVGLGFLWAAFPNVVAPELDATAIKSIRMFFCLAAILAGVFGAMTLSKKTLIQAAVGALGIVAVMC